MLDLVAISSVSPSGVPFASWSRIQFRAPVYFHPFFPHAPPSVNLFCCNFWSELEPSYTLLFCPRETLGENRCREAEEIDSKFAAAKTASPSLPISDLSL